MKIKHVASLLFMPKDDIDAAIKVGIKHPDTGDLIKLKAEERNGEFHISDEQADEFILAFYSEKDRNRYIPVPIRRELLIESAYQCANCYTGFPLEIHHIIEHSRIQHNDPAHMIVLCRNCHGKCTNKMIDVPAQRQLKARLVNKAIYNSDEFPTRLSWDILHEIIDEVHVLVNAVDQTVSETDLTESKRKFKAISLEQKNLINNMGDEYFKMMRQRHQPYFGQIEEFLFNPVNRNEKEKYYEIVDEINTKISAERDKYDKFEEIFIQILDRSKTAGFRNRYSALNKFLSFTYFQCDVGKLSDDIA